MLQEMRALLKKFEGPPVEEEEIPFYEKDITDEQVYLINDCLFGNGLIPDLKNSGLNSTVSYLVDVVDRNNLKSLDELLHYYLAKRARLFNWFKQITKDDGNEPSES